MAPDQRWKVEAIEEYVKENNIIIMNYTETWLDKDIQDVKIPNFSTYRSDRKDGKASGGGVAIYLRDDFEAKLITEEYESSCEMLAIYIEKINIINIVVYRPPDTKSEVFEKMMKKVEDILKRMSNPEPTVIITGDFNFPFMEWKRNNLGVCTPERKPNKCVLDDEKKQYDKMMEVMDKYHLIQTIQETTRKDKNTLDLVFTNQIEVFTEVEVLKTIMSDHDQIEITTNIESPRQQILNSKNKNETSETDLRQLNFHHQDIPWKRINQIIKEIKWNEIFEGRCNEECTDIFIAIIKQLCLMLIPKKSNKKKGNESKERKKLINRMKMLRKRLRHNAKKKSKKLEIEQSIMETERKLVEQRKLERKLKEKNVIENMKERPKIFFDHIRKQKIKNTRIGPFKIDGEYIYDNKEICELLVEQYNKQFSRGNGAKATNEEIRDTKEGDLDDIEINEENISEAIDKLNKNAAAGPDGVPAIFLINTKTAIKAPLKEILRKSIDEGVVPDIFKMAYITPIHKGGSRQDPANYRPVSLTSHIMKVFERVIKKSILEHLELHDLIKTNQHGFVPCRSTQTNLLQHCSDVFEAMSDNTRIDTIYLDFAKAFDKVNHDILMKKVIEHKIKGKIALWIQSFLKNRKYRVVANGEISEEQDVISGVPQGTVLASILFIIMIYDIDKEVMHSIIRLFADDTKMSAKIKTEEDIEKLQQDLEKVYNWAEENLMEFNEGKFEQMSHGHTENVREGTYKTKTGKEIKPKKTVKDLGVLISKNMSFKEHINDVVQSCKVMIGLLLRSFETREKKEMLIMYNSYIRSKMEHASLVWNPMGKDEIDKIEGIQRNFTSKIKGMEDLDYHQRLKKLDMYSLERRRERFLIINAWEQLEDEKRNVLGLTSGSNGRKRMIKTATIPSNIGTRFKSLIHGSTERQMGRLFNSLPYEIQKITNVKKDTFKKHLDRWLKDVPDTPRVGEYASRVAATSNSIVDQKNHRRPYM